MLERPRLWQVDHPFYGPDDHPNECESFAELRRAVDALDEGMNHVYRWDWFDAADPMHDSLLLAGEDRTEQTFTVFCVLPRKSMFIHFTCPISHEQEPEVLGWLRGPRVSGALRRLWEPVLEVSGHAP